MTDFRTLQREAETRLAGCDSPKTDAMELIRFVFGLTKTDLLLCSVRPAQETQLRLFSELVGKRASGYPLQYILGEWDFCGFTYFVHEGVLIPRPETEQLAEEACARLKQKKKAVVFDLCAGSGCIGLSVAADNPDCQVYLLENAGEAILCEKQNKERYSLDNVTILDYDIFSGFDGRRLPEPDGILCNPPYVTRDEYKTLQTEIFYEPETAIVCGGDGLAFYRCLVKDWLIHLKKDGFFLFECGEGQMEKIMEMLDANWIAEARKDMYGVYRFLYGEKI